MNKKTSPSMDGHLRFMLGCKRGGLGNLRPGHYENQRTHDALIRRGLVADGARDQNGHVPTWLTDEGVTAAEKAEAKG